MAREAVVETVTGSGGVLRLGQEGFASSDDFDAGSESVVALNDTTDIAPGEFIIHHKVVAGVLTVMSGGEKAAVDAVFPEVVEHRAQFVLDVRDPGIDDDIGKGIFPGCRWLRSDVEKVFWQQSNALGAAVWIQLGTGGGGPSVVPFISVVRTLTIPIPTSPSSFIFFDTTILESSSPPFSNDGSGTLTALRTGKFEFHMEMSWQITSSTYHRMRLEIYTDTGGGYVPLPAETTTIAGASRSRLRTGTFRADGYVSLTTTGLVSSGDTIRGYAFRDDGTATANGIADMQRLHIRELQES